jgi:hypothetical protein
VPCSATIAPLDIEMGICCSAFLARAVATNRPLEKMIVLIVLWESISLKMLPRFVCRAMPGPANQKKDKSNALTALPTPFQIKEVNLFARTAAQTKLHFKGKHFAVNVQRVGI